MVDNASKSSAFQNAVAFLACYIPSSLSDAGNVAATSRNNLLAPDMFLFTSLPLPVFFSLSDQAESDEPSVVRPSGRLVAWPTSRYPEKAMAAIRALTAGK